MRLRLLAASVALVAPFTVAGVAEAADGQFILAPTSGPAGTVITVSDADGDCAEIPDGAQEPAAIAAIFGAGEEPLAVNGADLGPNGAFSIRLTVPAGVPAGPLDVIVLCFEGNDEDEEPFFAFDERVFTVTAPVVTAPVTPRPAPTTPAPAPAPTTKAAPKAKPAAPVKAQPRFAG